MKKSILVLSVLLFVIFMVGCENSTSPLQSDNQLTGERSLAKKGGVPANDGCTTIQSGEIYGSDGSLVTPGYNEWGYNYQAKIMNGAYCDYHPIYRPGGPYHDWCIENYGGLSIIMKWNDAWLSNKDCDGDGLLDRHLGYDSYIGSGAWTTNHIKGTYMVEDNVYTYSEFVKIVAAPANAYKIPYNANGSTIPGYWYNSNDVEIGPVIWGDFAIVQQIIKDPSGYWGGEIKYRSPDHPGLGNW